MTSLFAVIATSTVAFAATNIDDIFVLALFFSQKAMQRRQVVIGQYLGFLPLILVSMSGFFGSYVLPQRWIGLLGLAPIFIGIRKFIALFRASGAPESKTERVEHPPHEPAFLSHVFSPQTFSVAAVTFANGGDNIGIYTPLFASMTAWTLLLMIAVFLILIAVWCCAGYTLSRQPHVAAALARYGDGLVPIVLIAIGVFVLHENDSLSLLSGS